MSKGVMITIGVVVVLLLIVFAGYNSAVSKDEAVSAQWAQVENQLKRRYDLIPNLIETVKGYASHEKDLFKHIADARTKYFSAKDTKSKIAASNQLEGVLSKLLLLKEAYPNLKANENFLKLQDSLEGTENRIAVQRMRYNEKVKELNTFRRKLHGKFFASLAGVEAAEYYEVPEAEKEVPKVKF